MQLKYKEVYEKSKAQINIDPEAHEIRAAKEAYRNITNVRVFSRPTGKHYYCYLSILRCEVLDLVLTEVEPLSSSPTRRNMKPPRTSGSGQ